MTLVKYEKEICIATWIVLCNSGFAYVFSRAIYASLLPQVKVAKASAGTIATEIQTDRFQVKSDVEKRVYVPAELGEENLTVEELLVKMEARFRAGEALVRVLAFR